jgi:hypothetical protein
MSDDLKDKTLGSIAVSTSWTLLADLALLELKS